MPGLIFLQTPAALDAGSANHLVDDTHPTCCNLSLLLFIFCFCTLLIDFCITSTASLPLFLFFHDCMYVYVFHVFPEVIF